jgi:hypothetical protein
MSIFLDFIDTLLKHVAENDITNRAFDARLFQTIPGPALLGIIGPGRISSDKTSRMEPPGVITSTSTVAGAAVMIATTAVTIAATAVMIAATAVMIAAATVTITAAAEATGAGVTAGIAISITAGVGSRSRAIPTTATPSQGIGGHEERGRADGKSGSEDFGQHSLLIGF